MLRWLLPFALVVAACSSDGAGGVDAGPDASAQACEHEPCALTFVEPPAPVTLDGCTYASPVAYRAAGGTEVLVVASETLSALSTGGELLWSLTLPAPDGEMAFAVATPVVVGHRLVVGYHTVVRTSDPHDVNLERERQMLAVIDLRARELDPDFEPVELHAEFAANDGAVVTFTATNTLGRALTHVAKVAPPRSAGAMPSQGGGLGRVYATFGNAKDIQPWHGFIFELDLDAWQRAGAAAAISASFLSTPEADCGTPGMSGSRERVCGGGMWSPAGALLVERDDGPELFVSTSNGQLDLQRGDYANSVLRLQPGLDFDPGCDPTACADFDPDAPALACIESCRNLFILRDSPGDAFPLPESGTCDGLTMFECWAKLDYVGGSTATYVKLASGREVLAYPAKDGALYLFDAEHLGTMYDRKQLVSVCGTARDECLWDWAGMIVNQPALTDASGEPLLLVPTFMPDRTHAAGVFALAVVEHDDGPKLELRWQTPRADDPAALERFRRHTSRIRLSHEGRVAWLVEAAATGKRGRLLALRTEDGEILFDQALRGPGFRFTQPLLVSDRLFVPSCQPDFGPSSIEIVSVR